MSNLNIEWKSCTDNSSVIKGDNLVSTPTNDHPLKITPVTERIPRRFLGNQASTGRTTPISTPSAMLEPLSKALEGFDPLTAFAIEEMDPLSKIAAEENQQRQDSMESKKLTVDQKTQIDLWTSQKAEILSKFTTSEKISIVTSFLSDGDKVIVKAQSTAVDKIQHRLEQLDTFEEVSQTKLNLSQAEYVNRIEQLNKELVTAWNSEQRVKALKIAIQCTKLLADTSVLRFYPSKFVLITDILDVFGQLVYNRLSTKSDSSNRLGRKSVDDFTPEMVSDSAKETCLNWLYKIASIRELVPRLYVEMALIKTYLFLSVSECEEVLHRLAEMISGIGDPLVAIYARCYLCRVGNNLSSRINKKQYLLQNLHRFLDSYHHLFNQSVKTELACQKMPFGTYMTLFTPALHYMLHSVARDAPDALLDDLLNKCKSRGNSSLILNTIMSAFKPNSISIRTLQFFEVIEQSRDDGIPLHTMLRTLGLCVSVVPPPPEHRKQILNIAWKHISKLSEVEEYIVCAEPWVLFIVKNFSFREINIILGDIIDHLTHDRSYEQHYGTLKFIVESIVSNVQDLETLLAMGNFMPLIDLFQEESVRVEVCKRILSSNHSDHLINDPVIVNAVTFLCGTLHDSVNALTPEDEYKQIGDILCHVIRTINYGKDFEQQLTFYVEARGMFSNIDIVFVQLVQCVNALSVNTQKIVKGLHTRKTADFVRACAAYCFITIPSIKSAKHRLKLYLLSGQVALFNQCLGQAEACFKGALSTISEIEKDKSQLSESELVSYIKQFLGVLLVVPDNPDCSVLYLTRSLLNLLQGYEWEAPTSLIVIYLSVIDLLSNMAQDWYPYHINKVESNDSLYGSDRKFISEVNKTCSVVLGELIAALQKLGSGNRQSALAVELIVRLALRNDLSNHTTALASNLWNLAKNDDSFDKHYMKRTKDYLKKVGFSYNNTCLQKLVENLNP